LLLTQIPKLGNRRRARPSFHWLLRRFSRPILAIEGAHWSPVFRDDEESVGAKPMQELALLVSQRTDREKSDGANRPYRSLGLIRLLRDLQASHLYPLPEKQQQIVPGRTTLGLEPVAA
jgi:hypothetical protein